VWLLLIVGAVVLLSSRKAGQRTPIRAPGTTTTQLSPEEVAAGWQQSAGTSTVPQEIARQHQIAGVGAGLAGAATTAAVSALIPTLSAAAATGIGAIVVGAVILIDLLRGRVHLTANDFVQRFQNPFKDSLAEIIDPHDQRMAAGTETLDQARETYDAIAFLWDQFQIAAHEYAQQSHDAQIVVDQGLHTLNGPNGLPGFPDGFINFMLNKLAGEIDQLAGGNALSALTGTF
jgi:hypothetical protein